MKKLLLSVPISVIVMVSAVSLAAGVLDMKIETGALKDAAKAVTKTTMSFDSMQDAKLLFRGEQASSLRFYKEDDADFSLMTGVGDGIVEIPVYWFIAGNYIAVNTKEADGCAALSLEKCREESEYLNEMSFVIP
jgi:hypothetical protein